MGWAFACSAIGFVVASGVLLPAFPEPLMDAKWWWLSSQAVPVVACGLAWFWTLATAPVMADPEFSQRAQVLGRIAASGVAVEEEGDARGVYWYGSLRDRATIGLAFDQSASRDNVCLYCRYVDFLRRPRSVYRLFQDVLTVVRFSVRKAGA